MSTQYITADDLDTALGADERSRLAAAGLTPERYASTIDVVNAEIAGYVGARPLHYVPAAFRHHACAIARLRLHKDKATERIREDAEEAVRFFEKVAAGKWALPAVDDPDTPEDESAAEGMWFVARPRRFGRPW